MVGNKKRMKARRKLASERVGWGKAIIAQTVVTIYFLLGDKTESNATSALLA